MFESPDQGHINELSQAAASGDEAALAELVRQTTPRLLRYLHTKGANTQDAEDIVQDAWRRVIVRFDEFDTSRNFLAWIFVITRNLWIDSRRKAQRRIDQHALQDVAARSDKDVDFDAMDRVTHCLSALSDEYRTIIRLRYSEGLDLRDVAHHLGITYASAKGKCCRAIRQLRTCMGLEVPKKSVESASADRGSA